MGDEVALAMSAVMVIIGSAMIVWGVLHVVAHLIAFVADRLYGER